MKKLKMGLDCDEVLFEFFRGYLDFLKDKHGKFCRYENTFDYRIWVSFPEITQEEVFRWMGEYFISPEIESISPVKEAVEGIERLAQNYELHVITSRPDWTKDITQAMLERHFSRRFEAVHYAKGRDFKEASKSKAEIVKELGLIGYVEDCFEYAADCMNEGTRVLLFDKPWNRNFVLPNSMPRVYSWQQTTSRLLLMGGRLR
jgi:uncharacterized HAD superfamily protein